MRPQKWPGKWKKCILRRNDSLLMKWIIRVFVVLVLGSAALGAVWYVRRDQTAETSFRTAPVARGTILYSITATGTLR